MKERRKDLMKGGRSIGESAESLQKTREIVMISVLFMPTISWKKEERKTVEVRESLRLTCLGMCVKKQALH